MITERHFAASHHAFWQGLLPMGEHYIRTINCGLARYRPPIVSQSSPRHHGVVNELAFRLFSRAVKSGLNLSAVSASVIESELAETMHFISTFRQHGRGPLPRLGDTELKEARELAERTAEFFDKSAGHLALTIRPPFQGCGWVSGCEGDVLAGGVLYEVKSGDRNFRMLDLRQALIYCALDFSAKVYGVSELCLVNPRRGLYFSESLANLCDYLSGRGYTDVLGDIVEYTCEVDTRDESA